jgi:hypothetical protein
VKPLDVERLESRVKLFGHRAFWLVAAVCEPIQIAVARGG